MKSFKVFILMVTLVVLGAFVMPKAQAAELKFAYVNLSKLFDEYEKTKSYDKVLEADNTKFQEERNKKIEAIRELQGKAGALKADEKAKVDQDIEKAKNDLLEFDRQKRTDLTKARDEKVREILMEIEKTVSEYAKKEGISFVFNDRVLIYGADTMNITDPIMKDLNEAYKGK
ncbi:MAG: OmpH family outer membrane protein [Candidatus Omnitrophica bacterium]|nr:OmpH family outer membrane protein [Candidatus Omnitrophota bacterium]